MRREIITIALAAAALVGGTTGPAVASTAALGDDGTIYRLRSGAYGDLFPDQPAVPAEHQVLALEIHNADGITRTLVPETDSAAAEIGPSLVLDKPTGTVYLLWEGLLNNQVHAVLHLVSHTADGWSEVHELTGNPYTRKAAPQLVVTRDSWIQFEPPAVPETRQRVTLHVSWWEETSIGSRKWYAPIIVENGERLSWVPSWNVSDFLPDGHDAALVEPHTALHLQAGWNDRSVLVGYLSTEGDRVGVVELEVLPGELDSLADWARWQIINGFIDLDDPQALADAVADELLGYGAEIGFHPASLGYIARQLRIVIASATEPLTAEGRQAIANRGRWQIVNGGVKMGAVGMLDVDAYSILEIERPGNAESRHLIKATLQSVRPTPADLGAQPRLFLSERGTDVIIAWEADGEVEYHESTEDGWTDRQSIPLAGDLDADQVFAMLEQRARGH